MLKRLFVTANRQARGQLVYSRGIASTSSRWAATNFVMPALSPTMTEGNIASWKVKEGDSFAPGDVLLEIETDKATMDVEAQEEGVMAKITQSDGTKGVKVGQRIAVLAESDDDLDSLEIPPEDTSAAKNPSDSEQQTDTKTKAKAATEPSAKSPSPASQKDSSSATTSTRKSFGRSYPLYPSVQVLLHRNGISDEDAHNIPASGPSGRLLKGDVLAHLGKIAKDYANEQAKRIRVREHLDLSNIKIVAPKGPAQPKTKVESVPEPQKDVEMVMPITLGAVYELQQRMQDTLGVRIPVATIIARASDIANEQLPSARAAPTADELFDAVLGLKQFRKNPPGTYTPRITALADAPRAPPVSKNLDIIDVLAGGPKRTSQSHSQRLLAPDHVALEDGSNFSVTARVGEEQRAQVYLERVKSILELEPGRCIF